MILETTISVVFSFLGLFAVHRILVGCDFKSLTGHLKIEKTSYAVAFLLQIATSILCVHQIWPIIIVSIAEILTLLVLRMVLFKKNINDFELELQNVLEETLLTMKIGSPFRVALEIALNKVKNPAIRSKFEQIREIVFFNRGESQPHIAAPLRPIIRDLIAIDRSSQRTVQQLAELRFRFKNSRDFRHRSGMAARQARMQSIVLSIIYILLLGIVVSDKEKGRGDGAILFSMILFLIGAAAIFLLGRKKQWRV